MKSLRNTLIPVLLLAIMAPGFLYAQTTAAVRGKVVDAGTGESLPSATVMLIDANQKKIGKISKKDGSFEFAAVEAGAYTFRVNYVGFKIFTKKIIIEAGNDLTVNVEMQTDVMGLDEVVVVGEAETRFKSDAEVSVSKINASNETKSKSYEDLSQLIAGKAAGVHITPGSGNVGGSVRFDVRAGAGLFGSGQPVIFVDGVRIANEELGADVLGGQFFSSLSDINPDDIESVEILKGPAASALYGTSGSNGVVLIKTKNGSAGAEPGSSNYQYKFTTGVNQQAEAYTIDNGLNFKDANSLFRKGTFSEHVLSLGGSSNLFNYYASYERRNEDGILRHNNFERNSLRANFGVTPSEQVTINVSTNYILNNGELPQNDNNILGYLGNTLLVGPQSIGGYGSYAFTDSLSVEGISTVNRSHRFLGSIEGIYRPITDLTLRASLGYDGSTFRQDQTFPANLNYSGVGITNGQRSVLSASTDRTNIDLSASYNWKPADDILATTTLGTQEYYNTNSRFNIIKQDFPTQIVTNIGAGKKFSSGDEGFLDTREAGIFLSQDLSFNGEYLLSFGVRNDYASSVGPNAPSIFYPRASAAVRFDKLGLTPEAFNLFKFRLAYGQSGVLPGPLDASGLRWAGSPSGAGTGAVINFIGNPDITPERISELEFGLEFELNHAYGLDFTYYLQSANNSIVSFINAPSTGLTASSTPRNVGSINGSGFEASLYGQIFRSRDYQLDLRLIWNYSTNKVTSLGGAPPIFEGENAVAEGQPRAAFYTFAVRDALFDGTGNYIGPNVDTVRSFLGTPVSPHTGSFSLNFRFLKNFTLTALADWGLGGTIKNATRSFQTQFLNDKEYNTLIAQLGMQGNYGLIDTVTPALTPGTDAYKTAANRFAQLDPGQPGAIGYFESSNFLRIRELGLKYDFTSVLEDIMPGKQIKSISLSLGARNLALFKKYSGPDIELNSAGSARSIYRGQDFLTLQNSRVFYGTLSIGF